MILLAADTSGKDGSLALARVESEQPPVEILEVVPLAGGTFSAQLVPQIAALLKKQACGKADLAGFAVASGPGSFTGLRVGLAAIKALGETLGRPIAAVSRLEALARVGGNHSTVLAAIDAGRGQAYVGEYRLGRNVLMLSERLLSREEFLEAARDRVVVTADSNWADAVRSSAANVAKIDLPRADMIARIGWERILRGQTVAPEELEANYIRRSDAEILSQAKS